MPGYSCPAKEENTYVVGGNISAFVVLWNLTDAECCDACKVEQSCDVWVTGLLNQQDGDPVGCWRISKPTLKATVSFSTVAVSSSKPG